MNDDIGRSKESFHQCKICGASAEHSNYGVMSCSPCKIFFRRNATIGREKFQCDFSGECEINIHNRHICSSCRLAKCFASGMQADMIRCSLSKQSTSREKQTKELLRTMTATSNILARIGEQNQHQQLPTLNLLQSDNSTLYSTQWTLLSNLIYSYDESNLLSIARQLINEHNVRQSVTTTDSTLATDFFVEVYRTAERHLRSNGDLRTLSSDDRSVFLRNAAENVTCLGAIICWSQTQLHHCQSFVNIVQNTYGESSMNMIHRVLKHIDPDIVICKLALSLFTLCNNISLFPFTPANKSIDTLTIYRMQNTYAEVTWKYLLYKYNFSLSVRRFMNLIQCLLATTDTIYDAQDIPLHVNDIETMIEQTELALVLDDMESIDDNKN